MSEQEPRGRLLIISGPSGVGKDTVINRWIESNPRVERVISATTRLPREGEVAGVDYHFLSVPDFEAMVGRHELLEHKFVFGKWYGTPLKQLEAGLAAGKLMILKIDVQGAIEVMPLRPDATSIFILPPSHEELERRLRDRSTDSAAQIEERLAKAAKEIELAGHYQYQVVNADVEATVREFERIVQETN